MPIDATSRSPALLKDLKRRGLLDSTLVVWGGEFGRTPMSEKGDGRDHNPDGFTMWLAGGGVKGGQVIGATDEVGLHAVTDQLHVHDLHATILWLHGPGQHGPRLQLQGPAGTPDAQRGRGVQKDRDRLISPELRLTDGCRLVAVLGGQNHLAVRQFPRIGDDNLFVAGQVFPTSFLTRFLRPAEFFEHFDGGPLAGADAQCRPHGFAPSSR